jgi:hypothetical protein
MKINLFFRWFLLVILTFATIQQPSSIAFAKKKGKLPATTNIVNSGARTEATTVTNDVVADLAVANNNADAELAILRARQKIAAKPTLSSAAPLKSKKVLEETEYAKTATIKFLDDKFNYIKKYDGANLRAEMIFNDSITIIEKLFAGTELVSDKNIIKTIKQTACLLVAESHYGDQDFHAADECDTENIAQIRPPAYEAVYNYCTENLSPSDLSFIDKGLTCDSIHPYERPLCNDVQQNKDEYDEEMSDNFVIEPITAKSRSFGRKRSKKSKSSNYDWQNPHLKCINQAKYDFLKRSEIPTASKECRQTNGRQYDKPMIPASPRHSIFTGLAYLKLMDYPNYKEKMISYNSNRGISTNKSDDELFADFGAEFYNRADNGQKRAYRTKLITCLAELDKPEKSEVIEKAYARTVSSAAISSENNIPTKMKIPNPKYVSPILQRLDEIDKRRNKLFADYEKMLKATHSLQKRWPARDDNQLRQGGQK